MKKVYDVEVDCANCARKMEEAARRVEGVQFAGINFMMQRITIEFADGADESSVMKAVKKACKRVGHDCEIFI